MFHWIRVENSFAEIVIFSCSDRDKHQIYRNNHLTDLYAGS